ncbi:MAG: glycoside hydrolase family 3 N-terminal domain-containing protein [Bacteroidota bacterium]
MNYFLSSRLVALLVLLGLVTTLRAQYPYLADLSHPNAIEAEWVDNTYASLNLDQRLGQLFMIRAHSNLGADHIAEVESLIRNQQVGGLCFFQGNIRQQLRLTNRYQNLSRIPLMISMDAEWGLGMRLDNTISFPRQLALGAIQDNRLIYDMGKEIARQLRRLGVHISFSPVLDVNNNPNNPIINTRSFGEDRYQVTVKSYNYMRGLQDHGVMASAKHFPGHGDTDTDSHSDLPIIRHDLNRLDSIELYPFKALVRYGVGSFMIAHLNVPALDERENRPTTLSSPVVTDLLRRRMQFNGLIFTDAMEMEGVTKHFGPGEAEAEALAAGCDILLLPRDVVKAIDAIKAYLEDGRISPEQIEASVKRILLAKYRLGLHNYSSQSAESLEEAINTPEALSLKSSLFEAALTLVRDEQGLLPLVPLNDPPLACLSISGNTESPFLDRLQDFGNLQKLSSPKAPSEAQITAILDQLQEGQQVIVPLFSDGSRFREPVAISGQLQQLLERLDEHVRLLVVHFGNPYSMGPLDKLQTVLCAYSSDPLAQDAAAQAIFGVTGVNGRLPVTASSVSTFNDGVSYGATYRLGFADPSRVGMRLDTLQELINELANEAMRVRATPGMVVLVAREGRIVFEQAYGHHTYARRRLVKADDLYDLASVTKVAATTLAIMRLYEQGHVDLDAPLVTYLPELEGSNKADRTLRDMLAHHAGLRSWIPFYVNTLSPNSSIARPSQDWYRNEAGGDYLVPVTERLFMHQEYIDSMWHQIRESPLPNLNQYYYSDLGFYLMAEIVNRLSAMPLDEYVEEHFYRPLGIQELVYRPLERFSKSRIPPTERDDYFRKQTVHGYVHDMGAAMLGGVSGHAGLFGRAHDLAIVFQMLLQDGFYGGRQYLKAETIRLFTQRYPGETRRGLGFDMKQLNPNRNMNMSKMASERAFGHLGFTGTCAWADPEEELVFIFLSNRTYPTMRNNRLGNLNFRPRAFTAAYRAMSRRNELQLFIEDHLPATLE